MKIEKIATQYETRYISNDGKMWETEQECQQYEELLADPTPLKKLSFYDSEGNSIDIFARKEIPPFAYLVLTEPIKRYHGKVIKTLLGHRGNDDTSFMLPTKVGVWYNDWSEAYNGGYGWNGWKQEPSIDDLQWEVDYRKRKIEFLKKIQKTY
jgi:hypothetical protein